MQKPAQDPAKKLLVPLPPVPETQLTMLLVPQKLNTELPAPVAPVNPVAPETPVAPMPPPVNSAPLMHRPVLSTRRRSQVPAAKITVLQRPAVPTILPIMVLAQPVVTAQPALQPRNMLRQPVVLQKPAH